MSSGICFNLLQSKIWLSGNGLRGLCNGRSLKHGYFPIKIQYLTTVLERILFCSVVMLLVFRPDIPDSNSVQILYFCHAFIHLFLCYGLCLKQHTHYSDYCNQDCAFDPHCRKFFFIR